MCAVRTAAFLVVGTQTGGYAQMDIALHHLNLASVTVQKPLKNLFSALITSVLVIQLVRVTTL